MRNLSRHQKAAALPTPNDPLGVVCTYKHHRWCTCVSLVLAWAAGDEWR